MTSSTIQLPPCGLYRTGRPLRDAEEQVPAGILVYFRDHSNRGIPMLQLPEDNVHNVWSFHKYGPGIENDDTFIEALQPLREQGFYFLNEELETPDAVYPKHTLFQLGYNMRAEPILFIAQRSTEQNALFFKDTGYLFKSLDIFEKLYPLKPLIFAGQPTSEPEEDPPEVKGLLN